MSRGVILVVDDEEGVRGITAQLLRDSGYEVLEASDGLEAFAIIKARWQEITHVVCETSMPGLGGRELVERAKHWIPADRFLVRSGCDNRVRG